MRIDRLEIENFKCFAKQTIKLHPQFTLFIGENGSGKTSVLDALAVAASVWLVEPPDSTLNRSRREILEREIRIEPVRRGDRTQFQQCEPVSIEAFGHLGDAEDWRWIRQPNELEGLPKIIDERESQFFRTIGEIAQRYASDKRGELSVFPIVAYYGTCRGCWSSLTEQKSNESGPARRWSAFRDCFEGRVQLNELRAWFRRETTERGNRDGRWRPGFEVVRYAIRACLPDADEIWFDSDRDEIIVSVSGNSQPLSLLSDGQRMMTALVADLAIRAVTQNAFLVPSDVLEPVDELLPRVLADTPGLVLIDELDLHLHPKWQRHVASDLKATFPSIQFVGTSHSPQIIGELRPEEIRILSKDRVLEPSRSKGLDSNRVLEELMDAPARNEEIQKMLDHIFGQIDQENLMGAKASVAALKSILSADDSEITRAEALMTFLEADL